MTNSADAQAQLNRAAHLTKHAAGFTPHWITYVGLCGVGSTYAIATSYAGSDSQPIFAFSMISVIILVSSIGVWNHFHPTARRGFGKRWGVMMALWTIAWAAAVFIKDNQGASFATAYVFLGLAVIGCTWEAAAGKTRR
ncbi:hypothetical protein QVA66_11170 [Staphylococcus chromogenes]|nr:hypothetical protein [Staphylococcus chromogenes]